MASPVTVRAVLLPLRFDGLPFNGLGIPGRVIDLSSAAASSSVAGVPSVASMAVASVSPVQQEVHRNETDDEENRAHRHPVPPSGAGMCRNNANQRMLPSGV